MLSKVLLRKKKVLFLFLSLVNSTSLWFQPRAIATGSQCTERWRTEPSVEIQFFHFAAPVACHVITSAIAILHVLQLDSCQCILISGDFLSYCYWNVSKSTVAVNPFEICQYRKLFQKTQWSFKGKTLHLCVILIMHLIFLSCKTNVLFKFLQVQMFHFFSSILLKLMAVVLLKHKPQHRVVLVLQKTHRVPTCCLKALWTSSFNKC